VQSACTMFMSRELTRMAHILHAAKRCACGKRVWKVGRARRAYVLV